VCSRKREGRGGAGRVSFGRERGAGRVWSAAPGEGEERVKFF
jgi:hypothetical protein